jgi:hypothetical protein
MNLKDLKFTLLISGVLIFSQRFVQAEYPAEYSTWQTCRSSADCTISKDPCENYVGVNKNHFLEYTRWSEKELWHCRAHADNGINQDTRILCLDAVCRVGRLTGTRTVGPDEITAIEDVYKSRSKNGGIK